MGITRRSTSYAGQRDRTGVASGRRPADGGTPLAAETIVQVCDRGGKAGVEFVRGGGQGRAIGEWLSGRQSGDANDGDGGGGRGGDTVEEDEEKREQGTAGRNDGEQPC